MNDKEYICFECDRPLYEHQTSDYGLCHCEQERINQERLARGWRQCATCKRSIKDQPSDLCFECTANIANAVNPQRAASAPRPGKPDLCNVCMKPIRDTDLAALGARRFGLRLCTTDYLAYTKGGFAEIKDEPSDEDLDYVYRSLGATNPNKESPVPPRKIPEEGST